MSCLLALGFFTPAEIQHPVAEIAIAQPLMQQAWEQGNHRGVLEVERRWRGAFPAFRLIATKSDFDVIVLSGNSSRTLALGPGHLPSSAAPGETGNTVITGRRDTFARFLSSVDVDDSLVVETLSGKQHLYRIVGIDVVDARRSSIVLDTPQSMLSLVTAYPFDPADPADALRLVVTARMLF